MDIKVDFTNVKNMYETVILVNPDLAEGDYKKVISKFEALIKDGKGDIVNLEHWGNKKLAYPIDSFNNAWYAFIEFNATGDLIGKLEQEYIYDESVIRYLTLRQERDAQAFNKKRRENGFAKKQEN
jgi:small subunit ribosomal protein S6